MLHHAKQKAKQLVGHVVPGVSESYSGGGGRQKAARKSGKKYRRAKKTQGGRTDFYDGSWMTVPPPNVAWPLHPAVQPHVQVVTPEPYYIFQLPQVPAPPPTAHYHGQPGRHHRSYQPPRREAPDHSPKHKAAHPPSPPTHRPRRPSVQHPNPYFAMPSTAPRRLPPPPPGHATNGFRGVSMQQHLHRGYFY